MREPERKTVGRARALRKRMTRAEVILWQRLRRNQLGSRFRRQVPIGAYVADFACIEARLVVEVDGETHGRHREIAHDRERTAYMQSEGWYVHRIWNRDVYDTLDSVLDAIGLLLRDSMRGSNPEARDSKTWPSDGAET